MRTIYPFLVNELKNNPSADFTRHSVLDVEKKRLWETSIDEEAPPRKTRATSCI